MHQVLAVEYTLVDSMAHLRGVSTVGVASRWAAGVETNQLPLNSQNHHNSILWTSFDTLQLVYLLSPQGDTGTRLEA